MKNSIILSLVINFIMLLALTSETLCGVAECGEELTYEVSYLGIGLGTIKVTTTKQEMINNKQTYIAEMKIDTYNGIPFIDLHYFSKSWMDGDLSCSHKFIAKQKIDDKCFYDQINFDYN